MTDKILKEAFDKLTAIEEAEDNYVPQSDEERERDRQMRDARNKTGEEDSGAFDHVTGGAELEEDSRDDAMDGAEELTGIQDELFEIIERLDSAIRAYAPSKHAYWQSYGLAQLKIVAGSDEYATSDESINNLIKSLSDDMNGEQDDF